MGHRDWWPNHLNLQFAISTPPSIRMAAAFDYAEESRALIVGAEKTATR